LRIWPNCSKRCQIVTSHTRVLHFSPVGLLIFTVSLRVFSNPPPHRSFMLILYLCISLFIVIVRAQKPTVLLPQGRLLTVQMLSRCSRASSHPE
uniref:Uncharacterized protein n=1 Tax=Gasterosteus aculeatus TaxID=69293 RepID=G3Q8D8_GASAC